MTFLLQSNKIICQILQCDLVLKAVQMRQEKSKPKEELPKRTSSRKINNPKRVCTIVAFGDGNALRLFALSIKHTLNLARRSGGGTCCVHFARPCKAQFPAIHVSCWFLTTH